MAQMKVKSSAPKVLRLRLSWAAMPDPKWFVCRRTGVVAPRGGAPVRARKPGGRNYRHGGETAS